ncbi:leukocyte surface antigen CD47 isoform X2 [Leopardus geoffroyi]|uniref:leukocyte surface antigen CD47 isoform X2 n=1 Tax=Felis catus TaxID=9685 RepID=UPI001D1A2DBE|nr:leukocyte surface antigen CD47 isoform X2 [Felis catus]XP_045357870.1 leukocyte surface antigen CD47 isoform X2 [Leopardus geoffroyi]XP_046954582.1 leukocyte surface antigen CD47 isoform X2 [Lynx rufus]
MWPLVVLLLLGSACCGSAQLIFNITRSVEYTACNETVIIPCYVNNVEATNINEMYVKWKFRGKDIFTFDGAVEKTTRDNKFKSTKIIPQKLLNGIASLEMNKEEAVVGNYTCEVTELSREGETIIELKYRIVSWFSPNENILIVIFPILAVLLSWGQFGIVTLKYKSSLMKEKTILLFVGGLVLTIAVIVGAILFVPGEYSTKNSCGLGLIVVPTVILILLQYCVFMIGVWMSSFTIAILILQVLGYVLSVVGLSLCVSECTPVNGPLLISGLGIIALAELLGLVYMKLVASNQKTIQPPREADSSILPHLLAPFDKAVEEPLNE